MVKLKSFTWTFFLQLMVKISPFLRLSARVFGCFTANGLPHETFNKFLYFFSWATLLKSFPI